MLNLPNTITISRILLVPVFALLFAVPGAPARIAAFVIFRIAKAKTTIQMIAIGAMILDPLAWRWLPDNVATTYSWIAYGGLWLAAALTVGTGYVYFRAGLAHLHPRAVRERHAPKRDVRTH